MEQTNQAGQNFLTDLSTNFRRNSFLQDETPDFAASKQALVKLSQNCTEPPNKINGYVAITSLHKESSGSMSDISDPAVSPQLENFTSDPTASSHAQNEVNRLGTLAQLCTEIIGVTSTHPQSKIKSSTLCAQIQNEVTDAKENTGTQNRISNITLSLEVQNYGKNEVSGSMSCEKLQNSGITLVNTETQKEIIATAADIQMKNVIISPTENRHPQEEISCAATAVGLQNQITNNVNSIQLQGKVTDFASSGQTKKETTSVETDVECHKKLNLSITPTQSQCDITDSTATTDSENTCATKGGAENCQNLRSQLSNYPSINYEDFLLDYASDSEEEYYFLGDSEEDKKSVEEASSSNSGEGKFHEKVSLGYLGINSGLQTLIEGLTESFNFSSSLENLSNIIHLETKHIRHLAEKNPHIFIFQEDKLQLNAMLKVCREHHSSHGCVNIDSCRSLHICNEFVNDQCQDYLCSFGHKWDTNHNINILKEFSLENISSNILQKIVKTSGTLVPPDYFDYICQNYNSDGCSKVDCGLLHICHCFFYHLIVNSRSICAETCLLNHDLLSSSCVPVLVKNKVSINETPRDIALAVVSKKSSNLNVNIKDKERESSKGSTESTKNSQTVWSTSSDGDVAIPEICYYSVEALCPFEESGCQRLHSSCHYHWQVSEDGIQWLNLHSKQVKQLETSYCSPWKDNTEIPPLDPSTSDFSQRDIYLLLGRDYWSAEFFSMTLNNFQTNKKLKLRRLCTENIEGKSIKASTFIWYFLDNKNMWVTCSKTDAVGSTGLIRTISSADVEQVYRLDSNGSMVFSTPSCTFLLDFYRMLQINLQTGGFSPIKRRPKFHVKDEQIADLPQHWDFSMLDMQCVSLNENSSEYQKIFKLFNQDGFYRPQVNKIERIQNQYLWKAYQNKVKEMTNVYGSFRKVNERYLFHGTAFNNVRSICSENFDWRLYGLQTGHTYGQGTYFSKSPRYSSTFARPDASGQCYMFVALVAVGTITPGHPFMKRPPMNPETNLRFDTTVDKALHPKIFVKYDKQEYYPQYLVVFNKPGYYMNC